jgi:hypothetical protein
MRQSVSSCLPVTTTEANGNRSQKLSPTFEEEEEEKEQLRGRNFAEYKHEAGVAFSVRPGWICKSHRSRIRLQPLQFCGLMRRDCVHSLRPQMQHAATASTNQRKLAGGNTDYVQMCTTCGNVKERVSAIGRGI